MTTPFAQYVDGMMGERPILNQPLHLVGFYLKAYLASLTDRTLIEFDLWRYWKGLLPLGGRIDETNQEVENLQRRVADVEGKLVKLAALEAACHEYDCLPQRYHTFAKKFVT